VVKRKRLLDEYLNDLRPHKIHAVALK